MKNHVYDIRRIDDIILELAKESGSKVDRSVDRLAQVDDLVGIILEPLSSIENEASFEVQSSILPETFFREIIDLNYTTSDLNRLLCNVAMRTPKKKKLLFNSFLKSEIGNEDKREFLIQNIVDLFYNSRFISSGLYPFFSGSNLDKYLNDSSVVVDSERIKKAQVAVLNDVILKNEKYNKIVRCISGEMLYHKEVWDVIQYSLFKLANPDKIEPQDHDDDIRRLFFSLLTSHIGYRKNPIEDHLDLVLGILTGVPYGFLKTEAGRFTLPIQRYIHLSTPLEIDISNKLQVSITKAFLDNSIVFDMLKEKYVEAVKISKQGNVAISRYDKVERLAERLKEENRVLSKEAKEAKKSKKSIDVLVQEKVKDMTHRLRSDLSVCKGRIKELEYFESKYEKSERRVDELMGLANQQARKLRLQEERLENMRYQLIIAQEKPRYKVEVTGKAISKQYKKGFVSKVKFATDVLSRDSDAGEKVTTSNNTLLFDKLSAKYPRFDNFYKFRCENHHRLIYSRKGDDVFILDVMPHQEYSRMMGQKG